MAGGKERPGGVQSSVVGLTGTEGALHFGGGGRGAVVLFAIVS